MATETVKRRLAFQKSYSQEHGGWRRKSLIDDAKFETLSNLEFEKREKIHSKGDSISEEEDVFVNGDAIVTSDKSNKLTFGIILSLKDGSTNIGPIISLFENFRITIKHIETRKSRKSDAHSEVFLLCSGKKDGVTAATTNIQKHSKVSGVDIISESSPENKPEIWFPRHISELDKCTHLISKFEPELDLDHPGYTDKAYRDRRQKIADIAFDYKHGDPIPRVEYTQEDINTWGHVFRQLKKLFPTHACKIHRDIFQVLEDECGYTADNIPQLEDISNFLKRKTGFQLRPVSGLLTARDFLASLAFRVFQCTQYVRHGSKPDYTPEPDCIHELLGHVPMLADPGFAQFSQELGLNSLGASDEDIEKFATLYWFTIEFGLCKQGGQIRAYGAAVLSSYGELLHALGDTPERRAFDPVKTSLQEYTDQDLQPIFYVVESFEDMMDKMRNYAANIRRPYEVRYDPYTQTVQTLNNKDMLHSVTRDLRGELEYLERAIDRIQCLTMTGR
ncbi:hypothetical protein SNE40_019070 [Patella caerulea]|uniref:Biopterin-dependent aromatic amino acid hydroxylase family profile domain-containing protein n=1 Tax=Patella caerulea TaxID=87958 RepID=A0AAN8P556_PATCE